MCLHSLVIRGRLINIYNDWSQTSMAFILWWWIGMRLGSTFKVQTISNTARFLLSTGPSCFSYVCTLRLCWPGICGWLQVALVKSRCVDRWSHSVVPGPQHMFDNSRKSLLNLAVLRDIRSYDSMFIYNSGLVTCFPLEWMWLPTDAQQWLLTQPWVSTSFLSWGQTNK